MNPELEHDIQKYNPNWYYNIMDFLDDITKGKNQDDFIENNGIDFDADIETFDTCIVGEVQGYSGLYANEATEFFCATCNSIGNILADAYNDNNRDTFESKLIELYKHIKAVKHNFEDEE